MKGADRLVVLAERHVHTHRQQVPAMAPAFQWQHESKSFGQVEMAVDNREDGGHALYATQQGDTDPTAKSLQRFSGVCIVEIVAPFGGNTRAVFRIQLREQSLFQITSTRKYPDLP
jgi:hypothetical protein